MRKRQSSLSPCIKIWRSSASVNRILETVSSRNRFNRGSPEPPLITFSKGLVDSLPTGASPRENFRMSRWLGIRLMRLEVITQMISMHSDERYVLIMYEISRKQLANPLRRLCSKIRTQRPMEVPKCQNEGNLGISRMTLHHVVISPAGSFKRAGQSMILCIYRERPQERVYRDGRSY